MFRPPPLCAALALSVSLSWAAAPAGFPKSGNGLWYDAPGVVWSRDWLPVGNGFMGLMTPGGTTTEMTLLNLESLWSGGPFGNSSYNGGNKLPNEQNATAEEMQNIRRTIFSSPDGSIDDISALTTDPGNYGSYAAAGYLISTLNFTNSSSNGSDTQNYARWLDMDQALLKTTWTQDTLALERTTFCSFPASACVQHLTTASNSSNTTEMLPAMTFAHSVELEDGLPVPEITCFDAQTLQVRGRVEEPDGMLFEILVRVLASDDGLVNCTGVDTGNATSKNATVSVAPGSKEVWAVVVGGTNYDIDAGDEAHDFSFQGADPHSALVSLLSSSFSSSSVNSSSAYNSILSSHLSDINSTLTSPFSLSLGEVSPDDYAQTTGALVDAYAVDTGNAYLEWVLFNYGRYLLHGSARGVLPANLQGVWANGYGNPWSADYHANINIQMNYWAAEMTGLGEEAFTKPLWDLMSKTWMPRGEYTARVLYNITRGWTTHNEMNIFGQTGMKAFAGSNTAQWADYPESNAWMMIHVWDHFDYTNDVQWFKEQGWPLLKGAASFHLDKLIPDDHFNDSSLVTAPCNSPEQPLTTFGCAHHQQMIWQMFNAVEKGFNASGDTDTAFLEEIKDKRARMDKGLRVGSWGQLQEWKVEHDDPNDTHRHLSHLIGLFPGYAIASYDESIQNISYTKDEVVDAASVSLTHRGNGTGPDADSGWEKVWRAAGWAQLQDKEQFYHILTYAIFENFGANLFSLYNPADPAPLFQIDANLGYPAAVLNAIVQAPDVASYDTPLVVMLLPALPEQWSIGSIRGARIRGGLSLDMEWAGGAPTKVMMSAADGVRGRKVRVVLGGETVDEFDVKGGMVKEVGGF